MPERVVPDHERVAACRSLWQSRFGRPPSLVEILRLTGLTMERVNAAFEVPKQVRLCKPVMSSPAIKNTDGTETLTCEKCRHRWTRRRANGRKPRNCPACREEK